MKITVLYQRRELFPNMTFMEAAVIDPDVEFGVDVVDALPETQLLGKVFRTMNCVTGDPDEEICVRNRVRSMMVGDRVVLPSGKVFECAPVGWTEVTDF